MTERTPATVILVTHDEASRSRVRPVIETLTADPEGPEEIILVDNASSDEGRQIGVEYGVQVISRSGGFSDGCNAGVEASSQPAVVLLGHDTVPATGWLVPLVGALDLPDVGATIPTIEEGSRPGTFNTSGGHLTYVGLAWVSDHGLPIPPDTEPVVVDFPCGGAMAMKRETWDRFGGFRGEYFLYQEDSDLGWRLRLAGLSTLRIPESRVVHDYEFGRQHNKLFLLERNRLLTVLSNYRPLTLALLSPVLFATEVGTALVAIRDGWFREKVRAWRAVWSHREWVTRGRRLAHRNRVISDAKMLATMRDDLSGMPEIQAPQGVGFVSGLLRLYRRLVVGVLTLFERG